VDRGNIEDIECATKGPVTVVGGANGQRATWINGQSFDKNGGVLDVSANKAVVEFAKLDVAKTYDDSVKATYADHTQEMQLGNAPRFNTDRANIQAARDLHNEGLLADQSTYKENLERIEAREARFARLKNGQGTLEDKAARNALKD
jgi:hypothetical protein